MTALVYASLTLYAIASVLYLTFVWRRREVLARLGRWVLFIAWLAHLTAIGSYCLEGWHPLRDTAGSLNLTAWLVAGGYLVTTLKWPLAAAGAVIGPLALALTASGRLTGSAPQRELAAITGLLGRVHLVLVTLGVATFALAAAIALLYLLQESALRARRLGTLYRLTPPLNTLEGVSARLIDLGFPIFTLAVLSGIVWLSRRPGALGLRVEHVLGVGIWAVFAGLVLARRTVGVGGRRAALLTLAGFAVTALVLTLYAARRMGA